jgi:hypothetical protein
MRIENLKTSANQGFSQEAKRKSIGKIIKAATTETFA